MLAAIKFDHQPPFDAAEVDHVRTDRPLSLELEAAEPSVAQMVPHDTFGLGHVSAQRSCVAADLTYHAA
jgi:hypothetical protein